MTTIGCETISGDVRSFVLQLFLERDRAGEDKSLSG